MFIDNIVINCNLGKALHRTIMPHPVQVDRKVKELLKLNQAAL